MKKALLIIVFVVATLCAVMTALGLPVTMFQGLLVAGGTMWGISQQFGAVGVMLFLLCSISVTFLIVDVVRDLL